MPLRLPFPSSEGELNIYFQISIAYLNTNAARLGIAATRLLLVLDLLNHWNTTYPICVNKDLRTKTHTQTKNQLQTDLMRALRQLYNDIPESAFTIEDRQTLNLPKKKGYRTAPPVPSTVPIGTVNINNRLEHHISVFNSGGSKAKPYLVRGCQIWYKIGETPGSFSEMSYSITTSKSPHIHHFGGQDVGKMVHYWLRWENTKGETGPWSSMVSATIGG